MLWQVVVYCLQVRLPGCFRIAAGLLPGTRAQLGRALRLSQNPATLEHEVILLFNSAIEELGLAYVQGRL